jgi:hypothetical protein
VTEQIVFVVTREGVYRHEVLGIYRDSVDAGSRALQCANEEKDGYHEYVVWFAKVDEAMQDMQKLAVYHRTLPQDQAAMPYYSQTRIGPVVRTEFAQAANAAPA